MAYCFTVRTLPAALCLWPVSVGTDTQELQVFPPLCSPCRGADTLSSACHTVSAGHAPAEGPPEPTTPTTPLTHGVTLLSRRPPWGHGEGRWAHGRCRTHRGHWRTCSCCVVCPCRTAPQEGSLGQALPIWSAISGRLWGHLAMEDRPLRTVLCASLIPSPDEKSLPQVPRGRLCVRSFVLGSVELHGGQTVL